MAFCSKCGNQILDNAKFCPKCGAPVAAPTGNEETRMYQQPAQQPYQQPYQQPVQSGKSNQTLLYVIIGALALLLLGGCIYYFTSKNNEQMEAMSQQMEQMEQKLQIYIALYIKNIEPHYKNCSTCSTCSMMKKAGLT